MQYNTTPRTCYRSRDPALRLVDSLEDFRRDTASHHGAVTWVDVNVHNVQHVSDFFNPFVGGKLSWDLGHGWGFGYLLGAYFDSR